MTPEYAAFLESRRPRTQYRGMENPPTPSAHLFGYQGHCSSFALHCGSSGLFLDTGLGKTIVELEFGAHAAAASNGKTLHLTPLAVARQIEKEALRFGYDARVIRSQDEARNGINICNYDRLAALDPNEFGVVVLDESSIIKNWTGKTTRSLIDAFAGHRWRLAATATPAPNDHTELGTHSEFLGVMPMNDMLVRWFINDASDTGTWRLKGHARSSYWDWMASWSRMAEHPRDLGDSMEGFDLPPLKLHRHFAESSDVKGDTDTLFAIHDTSATGIFKLKAQTAEARAKAVLEILAHTDDPFVVWVDTDAESQAVKFELARVFGDKVREIKGSMSIDAKESAINAFSDGTAQGLITKSSITGFGLNWQHCHNTVFAGRSFSYEQWYQAVRRFWRFGQKHQVSVHIVVAEGEDSIGRVLDRKGDDHVAMKREMITAMARAMGRESVVRVEYDPKHLGRLPVWL